MQAAAATSVHAAVPRPRPRPQPQPKINIEDFTKVELRVAVIRVAERVPKADRLLRLEVDLGYEQRQIVAGIAEAYAPESLIWTQSGHRRQPRHANCAGWSRTGCWWLHPLGKKARRSWRISGRRGDRRPAEIADGCICFTSRMP